MEDQRLGMDQRLKEVEERVTRDVRTRVFSVALTPVVVAAGAMLLGSFAATRDVNNSVIGLQKDIIAAQTTIQNSSKDVIEHTKKLADAQVELTRANSASSDARSKLETTTSQLDKARADYDELAKAMRTVQPSPR
jgi:chromosome segregation ATPase